MTNPILGYDCDGQALRAGDRVVYIGQQNHLLESGNEYIVRGPVWDFTIVMQIAMLGRKVWEYVMVTDDIAAICVDLRLINSGRDEFYKAVEKMDNEPVTA